MGGQINLDASTLQGYSANELMVGSFSGIDFSNLISSGANSGDGDITTNYTAIQDCYIALFSGYYYKLVIDGVQVWRDDDDQAGANIRFWFPLKTGQTITFKSYQWGHCKWKIYGVKR